MYFQSIVCKYNYISPYNHSIFSCLCRCFLTSCSFAVIRFLDQRNQLKAARERLRRLFNPARLEVCGPLGKTLQRLKRCL